jgi:phospholipase/carboxylesterase
VTDVHAAAAPDPDAMVWSGGDGRSLVLFLHGHGGVEQDMTPFFDALAPGAVGVSIRAPVPLRDRWTWFDHRHQPDEHFDTVAFELLGWLESLRGYSDVGAVGFSQGGAMAVQLMRLRPRSLGFAVQVCGFVMPGGRPLDRELAALRPPVLSVSGGRDDVVPAAFRSRSPRWLREHTDLTEIVHPALGHEITDQVIADVARFLAERPRGDGGR